MLSCVKLMVDGLIAPRDNTNSTKNPSLEICMDSIYPPVQDLEFRVLIKYLKYFSRVDFIYYYLDFLMYKLSP